MFPLFVTTSTTFWSDKKAPPPSETGEPRAKQDTAAIFSGISVYSATSSSRTLENLWENRWTWGKQNSWEIYGKLANLLENLWNIDGKRDIYGKSMVNPRKINWTSMKNWQIYYGKSMRICDMFHHSTWKAWNRKLRLEASKATLGVKKQWRRHGKTHVWKFRKSPKRVIVIQNIAKPFYFIRGDRNGYFDWDFPNISMFKFVWCVIFSIELVWCLQPKSQPRRRVGTQLTYR